jgi:tripartite-type tricarboxylate transporter receptor subunit TctC
VLHGVSSLRRFMLSAGLLAPLGLWAQAYPGKPVRIIVPFGTGGPDSLARVLGAQLTTQMGQSFVVENKPGANGILGADAVAKSAPDGYTLMITSAGFAANPHMYKKLPFDPEKDFIPVTNLLENPGVFVVVNPSLGVKTLQELIDLARKPGSKLSFGSPGVGNNLHLSGEFFNAKAGTPILHVPYKGAGPAVAALLSGETQVMFSTPPAVMQHIKAGKLTALAYSDQKRHPLMPDVPTAQEAGLAAFAHHGGWFGLFAPAQTPAEVINRLHQEVRTAFANPSFREKLAALGADPVGNSPAEFRAFVQAESRRYGEMIRLAKIQPE